MRIYHHDAAYDWWKRVGANIPVPVPWDTFEPLFRAEYVPDHYVEAKYEEFSNFTQGKLTLPEYRQQFDGLAEFGKDLVNTMEKRCKKFIKGMRPDLSSTLIIAPRADINDVYKKALELNEELIRKAAYEQALLAESQAVHSGPKMGHGSKRTFSAPSNSRHDKRAKSTPSTSVAVTSKNGQEKMTYRNPVCPHCNRRHAGECWLTQGLCLECGQAGHFREDCPTNPGKVFSTAPSTPGVSTVQRAMPTQSHRSTAASNQPKKPATSQQQGRAPARTYAMQGRTDPHANDVIMGMFTLFDITVSALIDPGSTLSYICVPMPVTSDVAKETLEHPVVVSNPLGHSLRLQHVYNQCPLLAQGKVFLADLIELPHKEFDVILGMDWLTKHQAIVECKERVVKLHTDDGNEVIIRGELLPKTPEFISFIQAKRLIRRKCEAFLCTVKDIRKETPNHKDISVVCDFPDVFPEELPGYHFSTTSRYLLSRDTFIQAKKRGRTSTPLVKQEEEIIISFFKILAAANRHLELPESIVEKTRRWKLEVDKGVRTFVEAKREEFLKFTQGELTLPEYRQKFDELAGFGQDIVPTVEKRCKRFVEGLHPDLSAHLIIPPRSDINALYKNALDLNVALVKKAEFEHSGECWFTQGLCLGCGQAGHFCRDCLNNPGEAFSSAPAASAPLAQPAQSQKSAAASSQPKQQASGAQAGKAPAYTYAMRGPLIDPGSTLSYVCMPMPVMPNIPREDLDNPVIVSNPLGHSLRLTHVYHDCPLVVQGKTFPASLIELPHREFDVILGIDWLTANQAVVDCGAHTLRLRAEGGSDVWIRGELLPKALEFISNIHARRLIRKKCEAFLCTMRDTRREAPSRGDIPTPTLQQQIASAQSSDDFCIQIVELVSRGEKLDFAVREGILYYRERMVVPAGEIHSSAFAERVVVSATRRVVFDQVMAFVAEKFKKNKNGLPYPLLIYNILKDQGLEKEENEDEETIPPLLQVDARHFEGSHFNDMAAAGASSATTSNPASVDHQLSFLEKEIKSHQMDADYHHEIAQRSTERMNVLIQIAHTLRQTRHAQSKGEKLAKQKAVASHSDTEEDVQEDSAKETSLSESAGASQKSSDGASSEE
ncbi:unnamed protein product [Cuscuta campestris]|uniref:CCHC-type domain-containing protein n=1 Tax=Cuscuta campestris TaxID=132261 RepID=A0A484KP42_9ASTE|nr:unnamed protein product [Cuscuta campestris]